MSTPRLEIRNVSKAFGGRQVVDDVSLSVMPGQVTCLLGPSGCGKSTTLRIAAGVDTQDSGAIYVDGQMVCGPALHLPPEDRAIGLMFQDFALFPHLTVAQNVGFGLPKGHAGDRVASLLEKVGMARFARDYPHQLSGGEQQRVALARALAPKPLIMLMDEPFSGLDDRLRDDIRDDTLSVLKDEGSAVLLVTHEPAEAMRMADQIAVMRNGRVVQAGTPMEIYTAPSDRSTAAFFSDINSLNGKVENGSISTVFGLFPTKDLTNGTTAELVIRPQHVKIDADDGGRGPAATAESGTAAAASVVRARFMGNASLIEFALRHDGSRFKAMVPSVFLPSAGTTFWLSLPRDKCFVFPIGAKPPA
ncbi:MAG: ABC transporter ATP-binding protein [Pseudomonadota bacterium]